MWRPASPADRKAAKRQNDETDHLERDEREEGGTQDGVKPYDFDLLHNERTHDDSRLQR
eukprot:CAMPEP_0117457668 /NCGR_PEP_ID=MMETSP0784-20121206/528_1 /TAXON_ID=39447 /ORGANISM="" /LENGTH=58 /DNA_ID=CAMNT_0005251151 /DNA_START=154 /DNA_END=330 /DNA_ORIENTATION=+